LLEHELNAFDAVVLDPPRAGAEAQIRRLAASKLVTSSMSPAMPAALRATPRS
jgi:tRNA/tmRNA/rRNA uracil-C5-methylase (TrmA/RlmC/RlmD family)